MALSHHTTEEAIAVNVNNAITQLAIGLASAWWMTTSDLPHFLIITHFIFLIACSNVSYYSIHPSIRSTPEFLPLVEKLGFIETVSMPILLSVSLGVWLGVLEAYHLFRPVANWNCVFGKYWIMGTAIDLKSSGFFLIVFGCVLILLPTYIVISTLFERVGRTLGVQNAVVQVRNEMAASDRNRRRRLIEESNKRVLGNHMAAWVWRTFNPALEKSLRLFGISLGLRELFGILRSVVWIYLVAATEGVIFANQFWDENQFSYGQVYPVIFLLMPLGVAANIVHRALPTEVRNSELLSYGAWLLVSLTLTPILWIMLMSLFSPTLRNLWYIMGIPLLVLNLASAALAPRWVSRNQIGKLTETPLKGSVWEVISTLWNSEIKP